MIIQRWNGGWNGGWNRVLLLVVIGFEPQLQFVPPPAPLNFFHLQVVVLFQLVLLLALLLRAVSLGQFHYCYQNLEKFRGDRWNRWNTLALSQL